MRRELIYSAFFDGHAECNVFDAELGERGCLEAELQMFQHLLKLSYMSVCVIKLKLDMHGFLFPVNFFLVRFLIIHFQQLAIFLFHDDVSSNGREYVVLVLSEIEHLRQWMHIIRLRK